MDYDGWRYGRQCMFSTASDFLGFVSLLSVGVGGISFLFGFILMFIFLIDGKVRQDKVMERVLLIRMGLLFGGGIVVALFAVLIALTGYFMV
ncbi:hypothetical protein JD969_02995 [Planctomycetota bacterium]|nr:hypothetical protein JD969_02995 [Planctomycetota bacterium]